MIHDLFKLEEKVDYDKVEPEDKRYYWVPLKL